MELAEAHSLVWAPFHADGGVARPCARGRRRNSLWAREEDPSELGVRFGFVLMLGLTAVAAWVGL